MLEKIKKQDSVRVHNRAVINFGILEPYTEDLAQLVKYLASGKIVPLVHERIPLHEAPRAHELLESGTVSGKIVLMCN